MPFCSLVGVHFSSLGIALRGPTVEGGKVLFLKNGPTPASFFVYFRSFSNEQYNFYNKSM